MKFVSVFALVASLLATALGCLSLSMNSLEPYPTPALFILSLSLIFLFWTGRWATRKASWGVIILCGLTASSAILHLVLPQFVYGSGIHSITHVSFISALLLLATGVPALCYSLFFLFNNSPRAFDISRYPLLLIPLVLVMAVYSLMIFKVVADGGSHLNWSVIATPFKWQQWREMVWQDGWPVWISHSLEQAGMLNHILGTFLLIGLTSAISLPIGVGTGIYISEHPSGFWSSVIKFSTQAMRAISVLIIAITAYNLVKYSTGTFFSDLIAGYYYDMTGAKHIASGSFLTASIFLSLLVIPIIAKFAEEGIRSFPKEIAEGSLSVGASPSYTLSHLTLPWAIPGIITGLILGCAETAGSLSVLIFIAGTGEYGVSPLNGVTSLSYFIFDTRYGKELGDQIPKMVGSYQFTAAFLLILITLGLTVLALFLKHRISKKYRGG